MLLSWLGLSIAAYQDYQIMQTSQKSRNWIFTHVGLSAHAHNNYCARG